MLDSRLWGATIARMATNASHKGEAGFGRTARMSKDPFGIFFDLFAQMTATQTFAFVILPITVAVLGWIAVLVNERLTNRSDPTRTP
jgi:hypothetical protein